MVFTVFFFFFCLYMAGEMNEDWRMREQYGGHGSNFLCRCPRVFHFFFSHKFRGESYGVAGESLQSRMLKSKEHR